MPSSPWLFDAILTLLVAVLMVGLSVGGSRLLRRVDEDETAQRWIVGSLLIALVCGVLLTAVATPATR